MKLMKQYKNKYLKKLAKNYTKMTMKTKITAN